MTRQKPVRLPAWTTEPGGTRPTILRWFDELSGETLPARRWCIRFFLALVLLATADLAVRWGIQAPDIRPGYTMPYNGLTHLRQYVRHVREVAASGVPVVVFLGDSSARGRIPAGSANLPEIYSELINRDPQLAGRGIVVFNFSVASLDSASKFYIASALADSVDVVLFSVNFRVFESGPRRLVSYPELWYELRPVIDPIDRGFLRNPPGAGESAGLAFWENRLDDGLGGISALWGRRVELKDAMTRTIHPRQWISRVLAVEAAGPGGKSVVAHSVWDGPLAGFPADLRSRWLRSYAEACLGPPVTAGSADVHFLARIAGLARTSHARFFGYACPYSRSLNAGEHFLDERLFAGKAGMVKNLPWPEGRAIFLDYNDPGNAFDPVPGDRYSQGFEHWTNAGLRLLAGRLHRDSRALLLEATK